MTSPSSTDDSSFHTGLLDALPVSHDATTSRVLVNNDAMRVVMFAMDAGQELTEHTSTKAVAVQQLEGRLRFSIGDEQQVLSPGDVIYLAPDARHAAFAETACRFTLVMVSASS
ncbi:MAG: hypothetical protein JJLCMIEE_02724 [Acidimicrobiales bacterium]|nr:MAG: cupin domain-containing protein [Actinomycetota bacterium]MBV6509628.1 hypothetical protein [Acidimicrobiales bacterium]RIK06323.1 MAG: cupin [Acidobacteriota bacterium]